MAKGERDQTVGGLRKTRHKGAAGVGWAFNQPRRSAAAPVGHPEFPSPHPFHRPRLPVNLKQIRVFPQSVNG